MILYNYCQNGNLRDYVRQYRDTVAVLSIKTQLRFAREIAKGVAFLHSKGIVHRDVSAFDVIDDGNVLFSLLLRKHNKCGIF